MRIPVPPPPMTGDKGESLSLPLPPVVTHIKPVAVGGCVGPALGCPLWLLAL